PLQKTLGPQQNTIQPNTSGNNGQPKPVNNISENGNKVAKPLTDAEKFSKKALRTYEGDVAEFMSHKRTSAASIAIAESVKQEKDNAANSGKTANIEQKVHRNKKIILAIMSIVLIGGGVTGAYYLYSQSALAPLPTITRTNPANKSLIPSDFAVFIPIDGLIPSQIISNIQAEMRKPQQPNTIKEIIFTRKNNEQSVRVIGTDMVNIMGIDVPDILVRSLTASWMLGEYSDVSGNKDIFIVATHNFFQNAFAGMLAWENVMADDLKQYIGNATSTSQKYFTLSGHFTDGIIKNRDAREFRTDTGNVLFLYSFIDNTKLVITSKEATLAEIISRLEQQAFMR
ncbi:MAG: hypothetical protein AAB777_01475, partial [Patescibacteria group bacterium]